MLPKISVIIRMDRTKKGKHPIAIQIRYKNQRKQELTGLYVESKFFSEGRIHTIKNADWYNSIISKKVAELEAGFLKQKLSDTTIDLKPAAVINRKSFIAYANKFYQTRSQCSPQYITRALSAIKYLSDFAGNVSFEQLTPQLLKDLESNLSNLSRNTKNRVFKRIKQPLRMAIKEGIISKDPFDFYQPPTFQQPKREFLTMEEIKAIENADLPDMLIQVRAYFLLSCYTGLRFSDLAKFDKSKSIITSMGVKRIIIGTTKTKEVVSIKLSKHVQAVIKQISEPIPSNVHCNRLLKAIAGACGIEKNITMHLARHSFAVNSAALGIPIEAVSRLLGHNNIRTTAIYFKIVDTKLDEYMDRWE